jgi:hypothetical protein
MEGEILDSCGQFAPFSASPCCKALDLLIFLTCNIFRLAFTPRHRNSPYHVGSRFCVFFGLFWIQSAKLPPRLTVSQISSEKLQFRHSRDASFLDCSAACRLSPTIFPLVSIGTKVSHIRLAQSALLSYAITGCNEMLVGLLTVTIQRAVLGRPKPKAASFDIISMLFTF